MGRPRQYPDEVRDQAVRLVHEWRDARGVKAGGLAQIGKQLGIHPETLRNWVNQAEVDAGTRSGTTTSDAERIKQLERENRELKRSNEILKAASAFFARELDPRPPK